MATTIVSSRPWQASGTAPVKVKEVQTITMTAITGGTWKLALDKGGVYQETGALAYDISTGDLDTALEALGLIGAGNIVVSGTAGASYVLTFLELLGDVPMVKVVNIDLVGTSIAVVQTTQGKANPIVPVPYIPGVDGPISVTVVVPATGGLSVYYTTDLAPSEGGSWTAWSAGTVTAGTTVATIAMPVTALRFVATTVASTYAAVQ